MSVSSTPPSPVSVSTTVNLNPSTTPSTTTTIELESTLPQTRPMTPIQEPFYYGTPVNLAERIREIESERKSLVYKSYAYCITQVFNRCLTTPWALSVGSTLGCCWGCFACIEDPQYNPGIFNCFCLCLWPGTEENVLDHLCQIPNRGSANAAHPEPRTHDDIRHTALLNYCCCVSNCESPRTEPLDRKLRPLYELNAAASVCNSRYQAVSMPRDQVIEICHQYNLSTPTTLIEQDQMNSGNRID